MKKKLFLLTLASAIAICAAACTSMPPDMKTAKRAAQQKDYETSINHYQRLADFGLPEAKHPDRPPQIGYWLGSRICQTYHESAADKAAALRYIFAAYSPEHMQTIAAPYVRKSR